MKPKPRVGRGANVLSSDLILDGGRLSTAAQNKPQLQYHSRRWYVRRMSGVSVWTAPQMPSDYHWFLAGKNGWCRKSGRNQRNHRLALRTAAFSTAPKRSHRLLAHGTAAGPITRPALRPAQPLGHLCHLHKANLRLDARPSPLLTVVVSLIRCAK